MTLWQAAIHPGLIDPACAGDASAKLEALLPQLDEVLDEGHKALEKGDATLYLALTTNLAVRDVYAEQDIG